MENIATQKLSFEKLIRKDIIGDYKSCKLETLYAYRKGSKESIILFAKLQFSKVEYIENSTQHFLGDIKQKIDKNTTYVFGLDIVNLRLNEGKEFYEALREDNWTQHKKMVIDIGILEEQSPKYIKADGIHVKGSDKIASSFLLGLHSTHNNINNGAYIIEFARNKKSAFDLIFKNTPLQLLKHIQKQLNRYSNIVIEGFLDKIGNIIIELPIEVLTLNRLEQDCKISVQFPQWITPQPDIDLIFQTSPIDGLQDIVLQKLPEDRIIRFRNNHLPTKVSLYDRNRDMIIATSNNCEYERPLAGKSTRITIFDRSMRTIKIDGEEHKIGPSFSSATNTDFSYKDWVQLRKQRTHIKKNEKKLFSKEYTKALNENYIEIEHTKAIKDVIALMNKHGQHGIYLIDPYIEPEYVLKTFYRCTHGNVSMKILGDKKGLETVFENTWRASAKLYMKNYSNHFGMNLEFRIGYEVNNYKLHDRFLIFPYSNLEKRPVAWSLGTSLNSFGKNFHLLHKVNNGKAILDKFNELWAKVQNDNCLIFKHKSSVLNQISSSTDSIN